MINEVWYRQNSALHKELLKALNVVYTNSISFPEGKTIIIDQKRRKNKIAF